MLPVCAIPKNHLAKVISKTKLTQKVFTARLEIIDSPLGALSGQYGTFFIDHLIRRQYSFASPPSEEPFVDLCVDISPNGIGSGWFAGLAPGVKVRFLGPLGIFVPDMDSHRKKVFVATGTGIVPFRSMIKDLLPSGYLGAISLYWGLRHEEDIYWASEFKEMTKIYPQFNFNLTLSRPGSNWLGLTGWVTPHVLSENKLSQCDFYLCGSRQATSDITNALISAGLPETQIKKELFY